MSDDSAMHSRLSSAIGVGESAALFATEHFRHHASLMRHEKSAGQVVTEADLVVETAMRDSLAALFPGEPIVGEEYGGAVGHTCWVIDPIDGTANFVSGLPFWGVALGHQTCGVPDLGVIVLPMLGVVVAAYKDQLYLGGERVTRRSDCVPALSLGHTTLARAAGPMGLVQKCAAAGIAVYQWRSSAVSLAYAALGRICGHFQDRTALWDVVPGAALCRAAGLDVRLGHDEAGRPWIKAADAAFHDLAGPLWETPEVDPCS